MVLNNKPQDIEPIWQAGANDTSALRGKAITDILDKAENQEDEILSNAGLTTGPYKREYAPKHYSIAMAHVKRLSQHDFNNIKDEQIYYQNILIAIALKKSNYAELALDQIANYRNQLQEKDQTEFEKLLATRQESSLRNDENRKTRHIAYRRLSNVWADAFRNAEQILHPKN